MHPTLVDFHTGAHVVALLRVLVVRGVRVDDVVVVVVHEVVVGGVGHLGLYLCVTGGMTVVLGEGVRIDVDVH